MVWWVAFMPLATALSGIGGVFLGAWLTSRRERRAARERDERDIIHLAIIVGKQLARFADDCYEVATNEGIADVESIVNAGRIPLFSMPTAELPVLFDPAELDVAWKALPKDLLVSILEFPSRLKSAAASTEARGAKVPTPEAIELSRRDFALLFLDASAACLELGRLANLVLIDDLDYERTSTCLRLIEAYDAKKERQAAEWRSRHAQEVYAEEGDWHDATDRTC